MRNIEKSAWAKKFREDCPSGYDDAVRYANDKNMKYSIVHNNETGQWLYAIVALTGKNDFWMWSFKKNSAAIKLCKKMGWEVVDGKR